ncbi:MAG: hypothetical protein ACYC0F_18075 [Rhodanobacter sp.]
MKIVTILFVFVAYGLIAAAIVNEGAQNPVFVFPTLDVPEFEFIDVTQGCGGVFECIGYIGDIIYNFVVGVIFVILFLANLLIYVAELFILIFTVAFEGAEGAPTEVNILLRLPFVAGIAFIIYKLIRSGKSED